MFEIAHSHRLKVDQAPLATLFTQHATRSNRLLIVRCTSWSDFVDTAADIAKIEPIQAWSRPGLRYGTNADLAGQR